MTTEKVRVLARGSFCFEGPDGMHVGVDMGSPTGSKSVACVAKKHKDGTIAILEVKILRTSRLPGFLRRRKVKFQ